MEKISSSNNNNENTVNDNINNNNINNNNNNNDINHEDIHNDKIENGDIELENINKDNVNSLQDNNLNYINSNNSNNINNTKKRKSLNKSIGFSHGLYDLPDDQEEDERRRKKDRLRKVLFTKILENKGSVARDHLANERTFLAWLRTGLSCLALGVALAKIGTSRAGGIIFVCLGTLIVIYSPFRYFQVYRQLLKGNFSPNRIGSSIFILLCLGAAVASLVLVLIKK